MSAVSTAAPGGMPLIAVLIGSIRQGRKGHDVGEWVLERAQASGRDDARFRMLDLVDYDLPLLTDEKVPGAANRDYPEPERMRFGHDIDACDAFVFVTAEYNHGIPGAFKNAFDSLGPEWQGKPVGFVSYGAMNGSRAVEQWRQVVATFGMRATSSQVSCSTFEEFDDVGFKPHARRDAELDALVDEILALTRR